MKQKGKGIKYITSIISNRKRRGSKNDILSEKAEIEIDETSVCKFSFSSEGSFDDDENDRRSLQRGLSFSSAGSLNNDKIIVEYPVEIMQDPIDCNAEQEDSYEARYLMDLERQLEDVENRKKMDLDDVETWKNLQKWRLEQQRQLGGRSSSTRKEEEKRKSKSAGTTRYFVIDHLDGNNRIMNNKFSELENDIKKLSKGNAQLQAENDRRQRKLRKLREHIASERERKKNLKALEKQLKTLAKECRTHQKKYEVDKHMKFIYKKTIEDIILKLQFQGSIDDDDDALFDHVTSLAYPKRRNSRVVAASGTDASSSFARRRSSQGPQRLSDMRPSLNRNNSDSFFDLFVSESSLCVDLEDFSQSRGGDDTPIASYNPIVKQVSTRISNRRSSI